MEDKNIVPFPEDADLKEALADLTAKMQQLNGKIREATETISNYQKQAARPAGMNRQSFRAAQRKGHRKGRKRRCR